MTQSFIVAEHFMEFVIIDVCDNHLFWKDVCKSGEGLAQVRHNTQLWDGQFVLQAKIQ